MCWNPKPASQECGICLPDPHNLNVGGNPYSGSWGRTFGVVSWHGSGGLRGAAWEPKGTSALPPCVWRHCLCNQPHHPLSPMSMMAVRVGALSFFCLFVSCPFFFSCIHAFSHSSLSSLLLCRSHSIGGATLKGQLWPALFHKAWILFGVNESGQNWVWTAQRWQLGCFG